MNSQQTTETQGHIFSFQAFSVHDGPGIRTTLFLKGCSLRCLWCHNPEGIPAKPLLSYNENLCIGCRACEQVCPAVHQFVDGKHILVRGNCTLRGLCVAACPAGALEIIGKTISSDEAVVDLLRDRRYYEASGGGVTLSGGEPLIQVDFVKSVLTTLQARGVHCAIETCGAVPFSAFEAVAPLVDLFLFDIKETNEENHIQYTGSSLKPIMDNLYALQAHIEKGKMKAKILIRCPIIPTLNDREEHLLALAALAKSLDLPLELLPYHQLGVSKSARMGTKEQQPFVPPDTDTVASWRSLVRESGATLYIDGEREA